MKNHKNRRCAVKPNSSISSILKSFLFVSALSGAVGCGPNGIKLVPNDPDVSPQESRYLKNIPEFEKLGPSMNLTGEKELSYEGSLIVWNPDARAEDLADVLKISSQARGKEGSYREKNYKRSILTAEIKSLQEEFKKRLEMDREANDKSLFYRNQSKTLMKSSGDWIETQVKPERESEFRLFCDHALLKMAASSFLRNRSFSSRPTPLAACERYYNSSEGKTAYFGSAECSDAPQGKNYFVCMWQGVLRSSLELYRNGSEATVEDKETFERSIDTALKAWMTSTFGVSQEIFELNALGDEYEIYGPGQSDFPDPQSLDLGRFLSNSRGSMRFLLTDQTSSDPSCESVTFNDQIFNLHKVVSQNVSCSLSGTDQKIMHEKVSQYPNILGINPPAVPVSENIEQLSVRLKDLRKQESGLRDEGQLPYKEWVNLKMDAASKLYDRHIARALWAGLSLRTTLENSRLKVSLQIDSASATEIAEGCFDTIKKESTSCSDENSQLPLAVDYDDATGKLTLSFRYSEEQLRKFGLKALEKTPLSPNFQTLSAKDLEGLTVAMTLYPRSHKGIFVFRSGSFGVFGVDPNSGVPAPVYVGSLNLSDVPAQ